MKTVSLKDIDIKQKVWNIIGKVGSGKSFLTSNIIKELEIPEEFVVYINDFEKEKEYLSNLSNYQLNKLNHNYSELRTPSEYVVVIRTHSKFEYDNLFRFLIINSRHIHFTIIIESQYPIKFPSYIRCNIHYYAITKGFVSKEIISDLGKCVSIPNFDNYYKELKEFNYLFVNNTKHETERISSLTLPDSHFENKKNVSSNYSVKNLIKHFESSSN